MTYEARFVCNREVRWIPRGWQHPKDGGGRYLPLLPTGYCAANDLTKEEEGPEMPSTVGITDLEIAAYETTTEGTPISPAFPDTGEGRLALVSYCAEQATTFGRNRADAEAWATILFGGGALVSADGSVEAS